MNDFKILKAAMHNLKLSGRVEYLAKIYFTWALLKGHKNGEYYKKAMDLFHNLGNKSQIILLNHFLTK